MRSEYKRKIVKATILFAAAVILWIVLSPVMYHRTARTRAIEMTFDDTGLVRMDDGSGEPRKRLNGRVVFAFWFLPLFVLYCLLFRLPQNEY